MKAFSPHHVPADEPTLQTAVFNMPERSDVGLVVKDRMAAKISAKKASDAPETIHLELVPAWLFKAYSAALDVDRGAASAVATLSMDRSSPV